MLSLPEVSEAANCTLPRLTSTGRLGGWGRGSKKLDVRHFGQSQENAIILKEKRKKQERRWFSGTRKAKLQLILSLFNVFKSK